MKEYTCTDRFKLILRLEIGMTTQWIENLLNTTSGCDSFEVLNLGDYLQINNHKHDTEDFIFLDNYLLLNINTGEVEVVEELDRYKEVL
jgi:hypothetical protein